MPAKKKYTDFESALARLEEISELMESGEVSLDNSLKLYTEGLEIAQFCQKKLSEAQKKIKIIRKQNGETIEADFEESEDV